jgi:type I restriction enzyme S subunit
MIVARPGDMLVSGINAGKGAIALYGEESAAYSVVRAKAEPRFLWWLIRSQFFRELLNRAVPGGIKTELKPKRLLPIQIPLPPIVEQHRIVERIAILSEKINLALSLQGENLKTATALRASAAGEVVARASRQYGVRCLG